MADRESPLRSTEELKKWLGIEGPAPSIHEAAIVVPGIRDLIRDSFFNTLNLASAIIGDDLSLRLWVETLEEFQRMIVELKEED